MQLIRESLDLALLSIAATEEEAIPLEAARDALEDALSSVYLAVAAGLDRPLFERRRDAAMEATRRALEALQAVATADEATHAAMAATARALGGLQGRDASPITEWALPLRERGEPSPASVAAPRLIATQRALIPPTVPLKPRSALPPAPVSEPAPEPPPLTLEALQARMAETQRILADLDAPPSEAPPPPPPPPPELDAVLPAHVDRAREEHFGRVVSRAEQLDVYADYLFEDLGMLGLMRQHREGVDGTTWVGRAKAERRLLAKLDGLLACGVERIGRLVRKLDGRPLPDPDLTWALLFLCGSLAGDDAGDALARLARTADPTDAEMRRALEDALGLAPHPAAVALLEAWLDEADVDRRAIAIGALGRRRRLPAERIAHAIEGAEPALVLPAVIAMGRAEVPLGEGTWHRALASADPAVVEATFQAALLQRRRTIVERAVELCREGRPAHGNAVLYAVLGAEEAPARDALESALATSGELIVLEAAGHFGDVTYCELLLACVGAGRGAAAAVEALNRIAGADLLEGGEVPEAYPDDARPFERGFRPRAAVGPLSLDAELWTTWWRRHARAARGGVRYRRGHPWSLRDPLHELEAPDSGVRERRLAHLELAHRGGLWLRFDQDAFVSEQERALHALRAMLGGSSVERTLGRWPVAS